jgi:hypothetical protein
VAELDEADQHIPGVTTDPAGRRCEPTYSPSPPKPVNIPSAIADNRRRSRTLAADDMAAVIYWRLPELTPNPGSAAWVPGIPETLHAHPVWGIYLAKRSQLVTDISEQVQDHACQGDAKPVWAAPETHLSTALIGEIAVWRAAKRHQSTRPATFRRSPTRNASGPVETTPRPTYRQCRRPTNRRERRRATGSRHPT